MKFLPKNISPRPDPPTNYDEDVPSEEEKQFPGTRRAIAESLEDTLKRQEKEMTGCSDLYNREIMVKKWEKSFGTKISRQGSAPEFERWWKMKKGENSDLGSAAGDDDIPPLEEARDKGQDELVAELTDTASQEWHADTSWN